MRNVIHIIAFTAPALFVALPVIAFGDTGFVPLAKTASGPLSTLYGTQSGDLSVFINALFKFAIAIGAIGAVLRLAYAGYLYMAQDMWTSKGKAKEVIGDVTLGVILLLGVWIILNQINPDILKLNALQKIQGSGGGTPATAPTQTNVNFAPYNNVPAGTLQSNGCIQDQTGACIN